MEDRLMHVHTVDAGQPALHGLHRARGHRESRQPIDGVEEHVVTGGCHRAGHRARPHERRHVHATLPRLELAAALRVVVATVGGAGTVVRGDGQDEIVLKAQVLDVVHEALDRAVHRDRGFGKVVAVVGDDVVQLPLVALTEEILRRRVVRDVHGLVRQVQEERAVVRRGLLQLNQSAVREEGAGVAADVVHVKLERLVSHAA
mmetsp:Transcript_93247/g.266588  ORF Transcript_93247/g.266588 Transcript_93247/m.266588 type:complete len:203 (+) Transcript_93247:2019-2627(+)